MFFVLCFFAFTSLTTVDLFMLERKMVVREVRGETRSRMLRRRTTSGWLPRAAREKEPRRARAGTEQ
jgi:hypothetical protein